MIEILDGEGWKDAKGYEGKYRISSYGRFVSINGRYKGEHLMNPCIGKREGYYISSLRRPGEKKIDIRIHILVANAFIPIIDIEKSFIDHLDGNKLNNYAINLERVTPAENIRRAVKNGQMNFKGSNHHNSILTEEKVLEMRKLYLEGFSNIEIAKLFNINRRTAYDAIIKKTWLHI